MMIVCDGCICNCCQKTSLEPDTVFAQSLTLSRFLAVPSTLSLSPEQTDEVSFHKLVVNWGRRDVMNQAEQ